VSLLADFVLTNDITTTLGATAYGTVWASTADYTYENCESRQDYLSGECREVETSSHPFPPGGHWLALHGAATYYLTDNFSLRGELITGGALGSVLGTEWLREDPGVDADEDRFLEGTAAVGIPFDSKITGGAGFAWTNGMFAVSLSGYLYRGQSVFENVDGTRDEIWVVTPMFNLAATF
jgi:hypothetical protein